jgi:hypothetical protein
MTITALNVIEGPYTPNGATTTFPFTFQVSDPAEVAIEIDGVAVDKSDFSVTLNDDGTGEAAFFVAPSGTELLLLADPSFGQEATLRNQGPYFQRTIEQMIDRAAMKALWLKNRLELLVSASFLVAANRVGKFPSWDADGNPVLSSGTGSDGALRSDLAGNSGALLIGMGSSRSLRTTLNERYINVKDAPYNATGNGVTDDSAAIRAAIAACGETINLYFPPGTYLVTQDGSNDWCLLKTTVNRWFGAGQTLSVIRPDPSIPDTCSIVREVPSQIYASRGGGASDLSIETASGERPGLHGWFLDTIATVFTPDAQPNGSVYERLAIGRPTAAVVGYGFYHENGIGNIQGGSYHMVLRDCTFGGGVGFRRTGDSVRIENCRSSGRGVSLIDQIVNAAGPGNTFVIDGWNLTTEYGLLQITNAPGLSVSGVNGENFAAGSATYNGAAAVWLKAPAAYSALTAYVTGDLVQDAGIIYRALRSTIGDTPASSASDWTVYDPFENITFHGTNLLSVASGFDGNAIVRIDAGERVSFNEVRMGVGKAGVKGFIVGSLAVKPDLRRNTWPVGFAEADKLTNSSYTTITDTYGAVTQATSKSTLVTLNRAHGEITMDAALLAGGATAAFQFANDLIAADDRLDVWVKESVTPDDYLATALVLSNGQGRIALRNLSGGALAEAVVIGYRIVKSGF